MGEQYEKNTNFTLFLPQVRTWQARRRRRSRLPRSCFAWATRRTPRSCCVTRVSCTTLPLVTGAFTTRPYAARPSTTRAPTTETSSPGPPPGSTRPLTSRASSRTPSITISTSIYASGPMSSFITRRSREFRWEWCQWLKRIDLPCGIHFSRSKEKQGIQWTI